MKRDLAAAEVSVVSLPVTSCLEVLADDYLASCRTRGLSPSTINQGRRYSLVDVFLPWFRLHAITSTSQLDERTLDRFTGELLSEPGKRGLLRSRYTIRHYLRSVRQLLVWCKAEGENVAGKPQLPRLPQRVVEVLSRDEIDRLEAAAPTDRDKLIIGLLADIGIRVGELCGLEADDIITAQDRRAVLSVTGKVSRSASSPPPPPWCGASIGTDGLGPRPTVTTCSLPLEVTLKADIPPRRGVVQLLRGDAERGGITRQVHPHLLHHSVATEALRRSMNPVQLAQPLGHGALRMIEQVYVHLNAVGANDAVMRMLTSDQ